MRLLFIKLKHIGDSLIMTPTLAAVRGAYPDAEIWVVVRKGSEGILAGCSAIDHLLTTAPPEKSKRGSFGWLADLRLMWRLRQARFDYAFELGGSSRGRWLAVASGAKKRVANTRHEFSPAWRRWFNCRSDFDYVPAHQALKDYTLVSEFLPLPPEIPPLVFEPAQADFSFVEANTLENFIVVHPATRWKGKQWPRDRWIELCSGLAREGWQMVLSCGPDAAEVELCGEIIQASPGKMISTRGQLNWRQMAGLIGRARLFIGVDTAAMHLAAACQTPIVALFGPTVATAWAPWKARHILASPDKRKCGALQADDKVDYTKMKMEALTVEEVRAAVAEMLRGERPAGGILPAPANCLKV